MTIIKDNYICLILYMFFYTLSRISYYFKCVKKDISIVSNNILIVVAVLAALITIYLFINNILLIKKQEHKIRIILMELLLAMATMIPACIVSALIAGAIVKIF